VYTRELDDRVLTFDFATGLRKNNLLLADRETGSVWSQLAGQATDGPLQGTPLQVVPSLQTTWGHWKQEHPETQVAVVNNRQGRPYRYRRPDVGLGLSVGGEATFFPFSELEKVDPPITANLGGRQVSIHFDAEHRTAWAEDESGNLLPGITADQAGWTSFFPDGTLWNAQSLKQNKT